MCIVPLGAKEIYFRPLDRQTETSFMHMVNKWKSQKSNPGRPILYPKYLLLYQIARRIKFYLVLSNFSSTKAVADKFLKP